MGGWAARSRLRGEAGPGCVRARCLLPVALLGTRAEAAISEGP